MTEARNWLITGCSSGFGRELARTVLEQGDRAVITARSKESLRELAEAYPDCAIPMALDLTRQNEIRPFAQAAEAALGQVDILVNNAGFGVMGAVEEVEPEEYRPMFETNFFGTVELTRALLPAMRARRSGRIVNVSSIAGVITRGAYGFYAATKFALEAISEALSAELQPLGMHVTLIEPGPFRTDFAGRSLRMAKRVIEDYADTAGASRTAITQRDGRQTGDPARAAQVIIQAVTSEKPPLRLPLGSFAYQRVREKITALQTDADAWEGIAGKAVEFDS
ncbi:MAG: SDR family NAD(P)-dependent oxidoreductase [Ectothiorhodospiraceae bacterium]|nr:SDR family NAD(P)-dependent oxidoreductase [Ectothiorhodospiraceae bacterium]MCH8503624.1 SDR family NAD(P)-dependent oxidoreductase [Ectothiorhodospiraceae bacterium]